MPAYVYLCDACGVRFERRQKMSEPAISDCPECGGAVKRVISGGAGAIVKGGASASAPSCGAASSECPAMQMGCGHGCGCH